MPQYTQHSTLSGSDLHHPKGFIWSDDNLSMVANKIFKTDQISPVSGGGSVLMTNATINVLSGPLDATNQALTNMNIDSGNISGVTMGDSIIWSSTLDFNNVVMNNVNIQSGVINTGQAMTVADITASGLFTATNGIKDSTLTSGRVVYVDSEQTLADNSNFTFEDDTLTVQKIGAYQATGTIDFNDVAMTNVNITSGFVNTGQTIAVGDSDISGTLAVTSTATITGLLTASGGISTATINNTENEPSITINTDRKVTIPNTLDVQSLILGDNSLSYNLGVILKNEVSNRFDVDAGSGLRVYNGSDYMEISHNNVSSSTSSISFGNASLSGIDSITSSSLSTNSITYNSTLLTATAAEFNKLSGVTATTGEINKLDGLNSTTSELNYLSGATPGVVGDNTAVIYSASGFIAGTMETTTQGLIENIGNGVQLNVLGILNTTGDIKIANDLILHRVSEASISLNNITALDSTTQNTIETGITSLPSLAYIQGQAFSLLGPLYVESTSRINQDLTSDATGVQFQNLRVGDLAFSHTGNTISTFNGNLIITTNNPTTNIVQFTSPMQSTEDLELSLDKKMWWENESQYFIKTSATSDEIPVYSLDINSNENINITATSALNVTTSNTTIGATSKVVVDADSADADAILLDGNVRVTGDFLVVGETTTEDETSLDVTNKTISVNVGGSAGSGNASGLEVEEDGADTGYILTNSTRKGWDIKAPADSAITTLETDSNVTILSTTATGGMRVDDDLNITGATDLDSTLNVDGNVTLNANLTIGNANTDDVTINSDDWSYINATNINLKDSTVGALTFETDSLVFDTATDRIGINQATPNKTLDIVGTATISSTLNVDGDVTLNSNLTIGNANTDDVVINSDDWEFVNASNINLKNSTVGALTFETDSLVFDTNNDRIGINTATPSKTLDVVGTATISSTLNVGGDVTLNEDLTIGDASGDVVTVNSATWSFANATAVSLAGDMNFDSNTFVISSDDNRIGINNNSPTYDLDVSGNIGINEYMYHNDDDNTFLRFMDAGDQIQVSTGGNLYYFNNGSFGVGIDPTQKLHVDGNAIITGDLTVTGNDITFGNGEYLSNNTNGTLSFNANLLFDIDTDSSIAFRTRSTIGAGSKLTIQAQSGYGLTGEGNKQDGGNVDIIAGIKTSGVGTGGKDGVINLQSEVVCDDDIKLNNANKVYWVDTGTHITGTATSMTIDADNFMYLDADNAMEINSPTIRIDTTTFDINAATLMDIDSPLIEISGDIDIEGDIDMASGKKITWDNDNTYIDGTDSAIVVDGDDLIYLKADTSIFLNADSSTVKLSAPLTWVTEILRIDGLLDANSDMDIEGDIDMATDKKITWVNDDTYISGTDSTMIIDADDSLTIEADVGITLNTNNFVLGTDTDTDISLTFRGNDSDGVLNWKEDEDYFEYEDNIWIKDDRKLWFRDDQTYIHSPSAYNLDLQARNSGTGQININTDVLDINVLTLIDCNQHITFVDGKGIRAGASAFITFQGNDITYNNTEYHKFKQGLVDINGNWNIDNISYALSAKITSGYHFSFSNNDYKENYSVISSYAAITVPDL